MNIRESMEALEEQYLSPYASFSARSRGRDRPEALCDIRPEYQRDRDRILHCKAFRRLKHKTQVFLAPEGDHYRTRLTHTLEVSQIARTIAKSLCLNESLTEAIALGHDLGHTPFGHSGEFILNQICEDGFAHYEDNAYFRSVRDLAAQEGAQVLPICAKLEQDIAELDDPEERAMFLQDLGIEKSGLDRLIQCSYDLLGLISFLTYGKDECRAWTIKKGTKAPQAAGKIHSDIERGFIRAETINFDEMMACGGSVAAAKEKGLLRSEGKEYVVKDGDMIYFRFNV